MDPGSCNRKRGDQECVVPTIVGTIPTCNHIRCNIIIHRYIVIMSAFARANECRFIAGIVDIHSSAMSRIVQQVAGYYEKKTLEDTSTFSIPVVVTHI